MSEENKKSLMAALWDKKVPQYLGTYFAVGFGLLQFVEFITIRYNLSGNLIDKYLLVWLSLLPAIALLLYFGKQLRKPMTAGTLKWPKILVIGNVIASFLLGGFLFNGNAQQQSTVIELTNEDGKKIKAMVPSFNKVKTIASFQFENLTGNEELAWWGVAFSDLLQSNLNQRPEYYVASEYSLYQYYDVLGLASFQVPNVGMQREISQKSRNDYFTRISYSKENNAFVFNGKLYNSRDGKAILDIDVNDENPFTAIDKIKEQIVQNIPDPIEGVENETDLPASTLITGDQEALRYFTESRISFYKDPSKLETVVKLAKRAVERDPSCAICHYYVGDPLYGLGRRDEAISYLKNAIKYGVSLPERMQFRLKETLYGVTNNMDSYIKLLELQRKMYPYEFKPYRQLAPIYQANYGIDSAKTLIRSAIDNGNIEKGLLVMYSLQLENEEYAEAEKTLNRFVTEFPDRDNDRMKFAQLYEKQGKIAEAKEVLLEEEANDPLNTQIQTRLAYLDYKNSDFSSANQRLDRGIEQATTLTDSLNFLWIKAYFLRMSGQINKSLYVMSNYEKYAVKRTPINRLIASTFSTKVDMFQSIDQTDEVKNLVASIVKYSPESALRYKCLATTNAIQRGYTVVMSSNEYNGCSADYESFGEGYTGFFNLMTAYQSSDFKRCMEIIDEDQGRMEKLLNSNKYFLIDIYMKAGKTERAMEALTKVINQKTDDPLYYYQMAVLLEKTDQKASKEYLDIALEYWKNADENYIPLQRAKELSQRFVLKT